VSTDLSVPICHMDSSLICLALFRVKADVEANQPDRFIGLGRLGGKHATVAPEPPLTGIKRINSTMSEPLSAIREKVGIDKDIEAYGGDIYNEAVHSQQMAIEDIGKLREILQEKMKDVTELEQRILSQGRTALKVGQATLADNLQDRTKEVGDLEKNVHGSVLRGLDKDERRAVAMTSTSSEDATGALKGSTAFEDAFRIKD
jgi:hypothetical protein